MKIVQRFISTPMGLTLQQVPQHIACQAASNDDGPSPLGNVGVIKREPRDSNIEPLGAA